MGKKENKPADTEEDDLFIDDEYDEEPTILKEIDIELPEINISAVAKRSRGKLMLKKRMDAYLERKWFREQGWDDDDELFSDEYFAADNSLKQGRILKL